MGKRQEAINATSGIISIINKYNQRQWIKTFNEILNILCDDSIIDERALRDCLQIFEYINGGYGSYSDFYINTNNKSELKSANKELEKYNSMLWLALK